MLQGAYPEVAAETTTLETPEAVVEEAALLREQQQPQDAPDVEHKPGKGQAT